MTKQIIKEVATMLFIVVALCVAVSIGTLTLALIDSVFSINLGITLAFFTVYLGFLTYILMIKLGRNN